MASSIIPITTSAINYDIAGRVEHLFEAIANPKTGDTYTNAEVARMSLGALTKEDVKDIRTGAIGDPTVGQVAAIAGVFGVEHSYLLDLGEPTFDRELFEALRDETIREATREIFRLPGRERRIVRAVRRRRKCRRHASGFRGAG